MEEQQKRIGVLDIAAGVFLGHLALALFGGFIFWVFWALPAQRQAESALSSMDYNVVSEDATLEEINRAAEDAQRAADEALENAARAVEDAERALRQ